MLVEENRQDLVDAWSEQLPDSADAIKDELEAQSGAEDSEFAFAELFVAIFCCCSELKWPHYDICKSSIQLGDGDEQQQRTQTSWTHDFWAQRRRDDNVVYCLLMTLLREASWQTTRPIWSAQCDRLLQKCQSPICECLFTKRQSGWLDRPTSDSKTKNKALALFDGQNLRYWVDEWVGTSPLVTLVSRLIKDEWVAPIPGLLVRQTLDYVPFKSIILSFFC